MTSREDAPLFSVPEDLEALDIPASQSGERYDIREVDDALSRVVAMWRAGDIAPIGLSATYFSQPPPGERGYNADVVRWALREVEKALINDPRYAHQDDRSQPPEVGQRPNASVPGPYRPGHITRSDLQAQDFMTTRRGRRYSPGAVESFVHRVIDALDTDSLTVELVDRTFLPQVSGLFESGYDADHIDAFMARLRRQAEDLDVD